MAYGQLNSLCFLQNMVTFHSWFQAEASFSTWVQWHHFCLYPLYLSYCLWIHMCQSRAMLQPKPLPKNIHLLTKLPQVLTSHHGLPATRYCGHSHRTPLSIGAGCCFGAGQLEQSAFPAWQGHLENAVFSILASLSKCVGNGFRVAYSHPNFSPRCVISA